MVRITYFLGLQQVGGLAWFQSGSWFFPNAGGLGTADTWNTHDTNRSWKVLEARPNKLFYFRLEVGLLIDQIMIDAQLANDIEQMSIQDNHI